jgi:molydopterin dinucleotide binding protein
MIKPLIKPELAKAVASGLLSVVILAALIVLGSRNWFHFDAALVGYTFAILFAAFGITYRYAMWLQRPPTSLYWKRGWQVFFGRGRIGRNAVNWLRRVSSDVALNRFILRRGVGRWLRLEIADGDWVVIESRRGDCTLRAQVVKTIRPDTIFIPYHWGGRKSVNQLTISVQDPISKIPEDKVCAVRLRKAAVAPRADLEAES